MPRILYCFILLIFFSTDGIAQCGYPVTINTNSNYCLGSALIATCPHALAQINWYKDGQLLKTAQAQQSLDTVGVVVAGGKTTQKTQQLSNPNWLFVDDSGNLYVWDQGNASANGNTGGRLMKYQPGVTSGEPLPIDLGSPFVDQEGDIYIASDGSNNSVWEYLGCHHIPYTDRYQY